MADFADEFEEFRARANSGGFLPFKKPQRGLDRACRSNGSTVSERSTRSDRSTTSTDGYYGDTEECTEVSDCENVFSDQASSKHRQQHQNQGQSALLLPNANDGTCLKHEMTTLQSRPRMPSSSSAMGRLKHDSNPVLDDTEWSIGDARPRVSSMPVRNTFRRPVTTAKLGNGAKLTPDFLGSLGLQKIRSFSITSKGLVKGGDFYLNRSHPDLAHPCKKLGHPMLVGLKRPLLSHHSPKETTGNTPHGSNGSQRSFHIQVTGETGVGVTSVIRQLVAADLQCDAGLGEC